MPKTQEAQQQDCSEPQPQQQQQQGRSEQCTAAAAAAAPAAADSTSSDSVVVVFVYSEATKNSIPKDVTHVHIDPSVTEIHDGAFSVRTNLIQVTFCSSGSKLRRIGNKAFFFCHQLTQMDPFPNTLEEIGNYCFGQCKCLLQQQQQSVLRFPPSLKWIGQFAFAECKGIQRVEMNNSSIELQDGVFFRCSRLKSIQFIIAEKEEEKEKGGGLERIGKVCFGECTMLERMEIPWTVKYIGKNAFSQCTSLKWLKLLERRGQLTTIGASAFYKCVSLIHVRVPSTVKVIERCAFSNCSNLISLEVPEHFSSSKDDENQQHDECCFDPYELLFFGCTSLVNLAMPRPQVSSLSSSPQTTTTTTIPRTTTTTPIIIVNDRNEDFLGQLQFRHVADNNMDNLMTKLQHRFDSCPVHKLCYYQSYYDEIEQRLKEEILNDSSISSSCQQVDGFGMTPFHILALSQTPNIVLFRAILKHYTMLTPAPDLIGTKDAFGKTPLDYLAYNRCFANEDEAATEMIRIIINQRLKFLGLDQWKMNIQTIMNQALHETTPTDVVQTTTRLIALLRYKLAIYERKEIISLIELALWDMQLNDAKKAKNKEQQQYPTFQQQQQQEEENKSVSSTMFRHNCRINCGLEIVISRVLPFLPSITVEDFTV